MSNNSFKTKVFYLTVFCIFTTYVAYLNMRNSSNVKLIEREIGHFLRENPSSRIVNFLSVEESLYDDLLVNTSTCKIPNIDPFDSMGIHLFHKPEEIEDCYKINRHWTYRNGSSIVFNDTAMTEDGYRFEEVSCCYKVVTRVEQSLNNYDVHADDLIKYSDYKKLTNKITPITSSLEEYLMVECTGKLSLNVYRGFHAIAQPFRWKATQDKIQYWKNTTQDLPPNILIIGTDTTSRLNFERNMIKTRNVLGRLGAVEMKGYTKSGESTRPAFCVMYGGYTVKEFDETCHYPRANASFDKCPLIWSRFSAAHYITAHSEDWPDLTAFSNPGFVHQPVDFYLRTLMNAAHDYGLPGPLRHFTRLSTLWCIGYLTNDEVLLDYTEALMDMAFEQKVPIIATSWSGTLPHSMDHNLLQLVDDTYAQFLMRLHAKGYFENTILIFLSDHGQRYGPLRETISGWYEDKLPNFWIKVPEKYLKMFPTWQTALEENSRRLTSPYHFHWTLNYIIDIFSTEKPPPLIAEVIDAETGIIIPRKFGNQHFLSEVPWDNTCDSVGVPDEYCACHMLHKSQLDEPLLLSAAQSAIKNLNAQLPTECSPLEISQLTAGARMDKPDTWIFVIGLTANPGGMDLEAQIHYSLSTKTFLSETSSVHRANQIVPSDIKCMSDKHWQLYCYCKR